MEEEIKWIENNKVDIRDLLSWLVLRWKIILGVSLAGCVLLGIICVIISPTKKEKKVTSVEQIRGTLSDVDALEVENAVQDYQIYQNYIKDLGRFSSVFQDADKRDGEMMIAKYYIVSRLKYCSSIYTDMAISSEDCKRIYEIAYPDDVAGGESAAKRDNPLQFISERDGSPDASPAGDKAVSPSPDAVLITVFVRADTEEQCKEILNVVHAAFKKETKKLRTSDAKITCRRVEAGIASEQNGFYDNAEGTVVRRLDEAMHALSSLKNEHIEKFSDDQKNYFNALKSGLKLNGMENTIKEETADVADTKKPGPSVSPLRLLEYVLAGFAGGFVLSVNILGFMYVLSDTIKSSKALQDYSIQTLDSVYYDVEDTAHQIARWIRKITKKPLSVQIPMLAEDIIIISKKAGVDKVYLMLTCDDERDKKVAGELKELVEKNDIAVSIGDPLRSREELEEYSKMDLGIILIHFKVTKKNTLRRVREIGERYSCVTSGFIEIEEC